LGRNEGNEQMNTAVEKHDISLRSSLKFRISISSPNPMYPPSSKSLYCNVVTPLYTICTIHVCQPSPQMHNNHNTTYLSPRASSSSHLTPEHAHDHDARRRQRTHPRGTNTCCRVHTHPSCCGYRSSRPSSRWPWIAGRDEGRDEQDNSCEDLGSVEVHGDDGIVE
jgi:hypothetical protein